MLKANQLKERILLCSATVPLAYKKDGEKWTNICIGYCTLNAITKKYAETLINIYCTNYEKQNSSRNLACVPGTDRSNAYDSSNDPEKSRFFARFRVFVSVEGLSL